MMKSGKKAKARKTRIGHLRVKKAKGKKMSKTGMATIRPRAELTIDDPPLTTSEIARVNESRQNVREGKYRDFATVDEVWKFAESD